jgi:hypothetical protein
MSIDIDEVERAAKRWYAVSNDTALALVAEIRTWRAKAEAEKQRADTADLLVRARQFVRGCACDCRSCKDASTLISDLDKHIGAA